MGAKRAANKPPRKKNDEGGPSEPATEITPAVVNWAKSTVSEAVLQRYEDSGELPRKRDIAWRAAGDEIRPKPREGEVVILVDHITQDSVHRVPLSSGGFWHTTASLH